MGNLTTTALILNRISQGDSEAVNELAQHTYPVLLRWAHGRIPKSQKNLYETSDLVHETLMKGIKKSGDFNAARTGAFLAYLRKIFINRVYEVYRQNNNQHNLDSAYQKQQSTTPPDVMDFLVYEAGLKKLTEEQQQAIILRVEFGLSHAETAEAMKKPSEDAARMFTNRAMIKLVELLKNE